MVLHEDFQGCQLVFPQSSRPRWDGFVIPAQFLVNTVSEQGKSCICYPVEHDSSHVLLKLFRQKGHSALGRGKSPDSSAGVKVILLIPVELHLREGKNILPRGTN